MDRYLNWSFDHNYHQEENCDYSKKFFECLENGRKYAWDSPELHYSILPNFCFSHKCPNIQNQEQMIVGELEIMRRKDGSVICYHVKYQDSTSGSRICLRYSVSDNLERTMLPFMEITRSAVHEETVSFRLEDEKAVLDYGDFSYCTGSFRKQDRQDIIQIYSLADSLMENSMEKRIFSMVDKSGQVFENCRITAIGTDKISLGGREEQISGYCLAGTGYPPSYWWLDTSKRVIVVSTILLTYVLG